MGCSLHHHHPIPFHPRLLFKLLTEWWVKNGDSANTKRADEHKFVPHWLLMNTHSAPSPSSFPTSELHEDTTGTVLALPIWVYSYVRCLVAQSCLTLCDPMDCSLPGFSVHGDSPGKYIGVGCHTFLQRIFPTQGSNPGLPRCWDSLPSVSPGEPSHMGAGVL